MHENKLIKKMVSILNREVESPDVGRVKTIHLEIGCLQHMAPLAVESHFSHIPKNDKLKHAKIKITELPIKVRCFKCGHEEVVEDCNNCDCKKCSSKEVKIISGNEFLIKEIEF